MRIYSIISSRIPTEKAHGFQVVRMCQAFVDAGADVTLITMDVKNPIKVNIDEYYGIKTRFVHEKVRVWEITPRVCGAWTRFLINKFQFALRLTFKSFPHDAVIYSRDPLITFLFSLRGYTTLYDAHNYPVTKIRLFEFLLRRVSGVIANSRGTASMFSLKRVLVAPNGVDVDDFEHIQSEPVQSNPVLYSGHLYPWKGVDTVLATATLCPEFDFVFIGGTSADVATYRNKQKESGLKNVSFEGHIPKSEIPRRLTASSVLLLPNNPGTVESEKYTSPIKMFEYMASGIPLIASDLPSLREVLDESQCTFFKAGDPRDLARALRDVMSDYAGACAKARNAKNTVRQYSWDSRAGRILDFIKTQICVE